MKFVVVMPPPDKLAQRNKKLFQSQNRDVFLEGVKAQRDEFWTRMSKERLRAPNRNDKRRLMRWTGTTARSYYPRQTKRGDTRPAAMLESKYLVARFHEGEPRRAIIRPVKKKMLAWRSGGNGTGPWVFAKQVTIYRRQPMKWTLKTRRREIEKEGVRVFKRVVDHAVRTTPMPPPKELGQ